MKLTIFCSYERKEILTVLIPLFDEMFIESHAYFPMNEWTTDAISLLKEGLVFSDYYLIIPVSEDLGSQWFSYIMGYAGSRRKQILINTTDDKEFLTFEQILNFYPWSTSLSSLKDSLEQIMPLWDKDSRTSIARRALEDQLEEHAFEGLARAVEKGDRFMVGVYLEAGFDINKESLDHVTLLGLAARNGYFGLVKILVESGAMVNQISSDRHNTPLMDAASEGHVDIVRFLIENNADIEIQSKSGQTALVLSVGNKQLDCALELLKKQANADINDSLGLSARKYAELYGMKDLLACMPPKDIEE